MTTDQPRHGDTITTAEQLDALPVGSVVRTSGYEAPDSFRCDPPRVAVKAATGDWSVADEEEWSVETDELDDLPATVLYVPGEQPPSVEDARADGYCTCNGPDRGGRMGDCGIAAHRAEWAASRAVPSDQPLVAAPCCDSVEACRAVTEDRDRWRRIAEARTADLRDPAMPSDPDAFQRLARATYAVDGKHHIRDIDGTPTCLCGFVGNARARTQTEHITAAVMEEYNHD